MKLGNHEARSLGAQAKRLAAACDQTLELLKFLK